MPVIPVINADFINKKILYYNLLQNISIYSKIMKINSSLLSKIFKTNKKEIEIFCKDQLKKKIIFEYLKGQERDKVIIKILERIKNDRQNVK